MGTLHYLNCVTRLDIPPDRMLEAAMGQLETAIIIGYDKDGEEYFAASCADGADALWLIERAKKSLLEVKEEDLP
jgi:hypothetical protein